MRTLIILQYKLEKNEGSSVDDEIKILGSASFPGCPSRKYVLPDILDLFQRRRQSVVLDHC